VHIEKDGLRRTAGRSYAQWPRALARAGDHRIDADLVFFETMTLLKQRLGAQIALRVGQELRENPVYRWRTISPELEFATWDLFQKYADKEWLYTDCALLILARDLKVQKVFSFDEHFTQMPGIKRLP